MDILGDRRLHDSLSSLDIKVFLLHSLEFEILMTGLVLIITFSINSVAILNWRLKFFSLQYFWEDSGVFPSTCLPDLTFYHYII